MRGSALRLPGMIMLCAAFFLPACAPPARLELTAGARRERYLAALEQRAARAATLDAAVALWLRSAPDKRLPGVLGELKLGVPDRFRLRVRGPLGTALDLGGAGNHIVALLPSRRSFFESDDLGDSLGLARAGEFVVRVAAALWRPPAAAWAESAGTDARVPRVWSEGGERVRLEIDPSGLPLVVELSTSRMSALRIEYADWFARGGTRWPGRIEIGDSTLSARLTCRIERLRWRSAAARSPLAVAIPAGGTRLDWATVMRELARLEDR